MSTATLMHWISTAPRWEPAAAALVALAVAWLTARAVGRLVRSAMHGLQDEDRIDPFTGGVTLLATGLSVDGMWRVFGRTMHLPTVARVVSCAVLELLCFAFMRLARKDILALRSAKAHTLTVWAVATLSACLSAASSSSPLEVVIRFAFPLLAVHLLHSWFLPVPSEITLSQLQKGKRAWRFVRATRRVERAGNRASRWAAGRLLDVESDRLTKRSLMTGDASAVLAASERIAVGEALAGLGIRPEPAVEPRPSAAAKRTAKRTATRAPVAWDERALQDAGRRLNAQVIGDTGAPASARRLGSELRLGHKRAGELRTWLEADRALGGALVEHANGTSLVDA